MLFKYVHVKRKDGTLRKAPIIPICVYDSTGRKVNVHALIDSGADFTVVPKDLADFLGIKEGAPQETAGIGGKVKTKISSLAFSVSNNRETYCINVPALIMQEKYSDIPLLLGRNGFFESFHITFKQFEEKIILQKTERSQY